MAAAYSTSTSVGINDGGQVQQDTPSFVVPAGATVYVGVGTSDGSPIAPSGVVFDPSGTNQAFTQVGTGIAHGGFAEASVWVLKNASAATALARVTWPSSQGERTITVWVGTGIDTTTPNGTISQGQGTGTAVSVSAVSTTTGQLVLSFGFQLYINNALISFNSPSGTERQEVTTTPDLYDTAAVMDQAAAGSSTTPSWTLSSAPTSWAMFVIPLNDGGGGGGSTSIPFRSQAARLAPYLFF